MSRKLRSASLRSSPLLGRTDLAITSDLDMEALKNFSELFPHFQHSQHLLTAFNLFLLEQGRPVDQHALHFLQELREYGTLPPEVQKEKANTLYYTYLAIDQESTTGQIVPRPTYDPSTEGGLLAAVDQVGQALRSWDNQKGPSLFGELTIFFHTRLNTRYFEKEAPVPFDQSPQAKAIGAMKGVDNLPSVTRRGFNAEIYKALPARLPPITYATKAPLKAELFTTLQDPVSANLYASGTDPSTHFIDRKTTLITRLALQQTPTFQAILKCLSTAYHELPTLFHTHKGTKRDSLQLWQDLRHLLRYDPKMPLIPQRLFKEIKGKAEIRSLLGAQGLEALQELADFEFNKWLQKQVAHEIWFTLNRREVGSRVVFWDSPCAASNRGIGTEGENPVALTKLTFKQLFDETLFNNHAPQFGLFAVNGSNVGTDQHRKLLAHLPQEWRAKILNAIAGAPWPNPVKKGTLERAVTENTPQATKAVLKEHPWLVALLSCHAEFQKTVDSEVWDERKGFGNLKKIEGIDPKRVPLAQPTYDIRVEQKQVAVTIVEFYAMMSGSQELARFDLHKVLTFGTHKSAYEGGSARIRNPRFQPTADNFWKRKKILDALDVVNLFPLRMLDNSVKARDSVEFRQSYYDHSTNEN